MEAFIGQAAALELVKVVSINDGDSHIASDYVQLADAANLRSFVLNTGAVVRNNLSTVLDGPAAEATLNGLSLSRGCQHVDNHTLLDHAREHCPSHELYKAFSPTRQAAYSRDVFWCGPVRKRPIPSKPAKPFCSQMKRP